MMANPSKSKGTSLETWTVRYLAWALQDTRIDRMPLHGNADQGDLIGVMFHGEPVCVECKDTKMPNYRKHWRELKVEMANMDTPYGVLIQHRKGVGVKSLKGMARQMAVFDIGTLERFLATHMGHVLGPDYREPAARRIEAGALQSDARVDAARIVRAPAERRLGVGAGRWPGLTLIPTSVVAVAPVCVAATTANPRPTGTGWG
jgi:hypothetical protein